MMKISARPVAAGRTSSTSGTGLTGFNGFQRAICLNGLKYSTGPFSAPGPVELVQPVGPGRVQKHWLLTIENSIFRNPINISPLSMRRATIDFLAEFKSSGILNLKKIDIFNGEIGYIRVN
ncbi:hypothetical protein SLEP1_g12520 [Rubroshorea leprosula]|uniref:Uncharacterized protein n=1 Tax=Rubroshorea leprosula TaxID=152421 RepID=A0AAV5ICS9_9ROSI|nr:hypothetical protein SLEP1_g12520 [Rubroshorea leprosula]